MKLSGDDILSDIAAKFAAKPNDFPRAGAFDYPSVIGGWISKLEADSLPYVTAGGIAIDGSGHLTMHDKEHVSRVRKVAADLVGMAENLELSPHELCLLLVAIYLHDIGNVLGRAGHEKAIGVTLNAAQAQIGIDAIEYATARQIAGVHGGTVDGSKDTISTLPEKSAVLGQYVRPRLLAAIVRLADELADDPARANRIQLAAGALPPESEVYHVIAAGLHSQMPDAGTREIALSYSFRDASLFKHKLGKGNGKVHLLNEIFDRSLKTFYEARYCSRFMRPYLEFERVSVDVMIFDEDHRPLHNIKYSIAEQGYGHIATSIYDLVPELATYQGNGKLTPAYLKQLLKPERDAA